MFCTKYLAEGGNVPKKRELKENKILGSGRKNNTAEEKNIGCKKALNGREGGVKELEENLMKGIEHVHLSHAPFME